MKWKKIGRYHIPKFLLFTALFISFITAITFFGCSKKAEEQVLITEIDGVTHIQNPATPLKGTILLEVEKTLEINPFEHTEIGIKNFSSARDKDGEVILFDSNKGEAYRFNSKGEYIGSLVHKGQGPGEFQEFHGLEILFRDNQIWAVSVIKYAKFDKSGQFLEEKKVESYPDFFVDENRYFALKRQWSDDGQWRRVTLVNMETETDIVFFEALREWLIRKGSGAFNDSWATPSIHYVYCPFSEEVFIALNEEYKIQVYDLEGKETQVIKRPHQNVSVSREEKENLIAWAIRNDASKWKIDAYPDNLAAIRKMAALPKGHLAVYRIVGPKKFEIDVYDQEGKYLYILKAPEDIDMEKAVFYDSGFMTQTIKDDFPVYCEYRIKNLPGIFGDAPQ
jgi:hypothetical protein